MVLTAAVLILATVAQIGRADFIIANTTSCYGAFPLNSCTGPDRVLQVISDGINFNTSFTCDKLYHSEDHRYINQNAVGPSSTNFSSTYISDIGSRLYFERNYDVASTNGTFDIYKGEDASGDSLGQCEYMEAKMYESMRKCSQWLGAVFFIGAYRCNTTIIGPHTATTGISSSTTSSISSRTSPVSSRISTRTATPTAVEDLPSASRSNTRSASAGRSTATASSGSSEDPSESTAGTSETKRDAKGNFWSG